MLWAPSSQINDVCFKKKKGFEQTSRLNVPLGRTKGRANNTRGGREKTLRGSFSNWSWFWTQKTPAVLPPLFPSLPITLTQQIKKGFHGCQEVLASCTRLWGYRDRPPRLWALCLSVSPPASLQEFRACSCVEAPLPFVQRNCTDVPFKQDLLRERLKQWCATLGGGGSVTLGDTFLS